MAKRRSPPRAKLKAHRTSPPGLRPPPLPAQPMKLISEFIHSTGRGGEAKNYGIHQVEAAGRERGRHKVGQSARWAYNCGDENDSRRGRRSQDRATRARLPRTRRVHSAHGGRRQIRRGPCALGPSGPDRARPGPARNGRLRRDPRGAQGLERAHHHAHRAGRGDGQARRPRAGRGRLRRQTVQPQRTRRPRSRGAAPHGERRRDRDHPRRRPDARPAADARDAERPPPGPRSSAPPA